MYSSGFLWTRSSTTTKPPWWRSSAERRSTLRTSGRVTPQSCWRVAWRGQGGRATLLSCRLLSRSTARRCSLPACCLPGMSSSSLTTKTDSLKIINMTWISFSAGCHLCYLITHSWYKMQDCYIIRLKWLCLCSSEKMFPFQQRPWGQTLIKAFWRRPLPFTPLSAFFSVEGQDKPSVHKVHSISLTLTVAEFLKV